MSYKGELKTMNQQDYEAFNSFVNMLPEIQSSYALENTIKAFRAGLEQGRILPKEEWISAVDRLPGNRKLVVVRCYYSGDSTNEKFMVAYLKDGNWRESGGFDTIGGTGWIVEKWAPLPPTKDHNDS